MKEIKITDDMFIGFMHGDGWLSSGYNHLIDRKNPIQRCYINCSLYPDSNSDWVYQYLSVNSDNKIREENIFVISDVVKNGGKSRKISVCDKALWYKLRNVGCPIGKKIGQKITWNIDDKTDRECIDFLIEIYSAEGCIYFCRNKKDRPSIQIGMNWKNCIDLLKKILFRLNIEFTYFETHGTYKIYLDSYKGIKRLVEYCDFRLDSRKRSKWIVLRKAINISEKKLSKRKSLICHARKLKNKGYTQKELKQTIKTFHSRWLSKDYEPSFRWIVPRVNDPDIQEMYDEAGETIKKKIAEQDEKHAGK